MRALVLLSLLLACGNRRSDRVDVDLWPYDDRPGEAGLLAIAPAGTELASARFELSDWQGQRAASGAFTPGPDPHVVGGLRAGSGYRADLNAETRDRRRCSGRATFDVVAARIVVVPVRLTCEAPPPSPAPGMADVGAVVNRCPVIAEVTVGALRPPLGAPIALDARAGDPDGDPLSFLWTFEGGPVSDARAARAQARCAHLGLFLVRLEVSDGKCQDDLAIMLECVEP